MTNYKDPEEIEEKIRQAEDIQEKECSGSNYSFAEGVIAALDWVTGNGDDPFMDFD